jgi:hypothetical protein
VLIFAQKENVKEESIVPLSVYLSTGLFVARRNLGVRKPVWSYLFIESPVILPHIPDLGDSLTASNIK